MLTSKVHGIEVAICGWRELYDWRGEGITHIISISGGLDQGCRDRSKKIREAFPNATLCSIFFDDVTEPDAWCPPTEELIGGVLAFTEGLVAGNRLLVQCAAGVSRSSALAYAVICQHWGPEYEIECFVELKYARPQARPNALVVEIADILLNRGGAMVRAIED